MDSEKIKKLGWNARYSIQEGLKRTIQILKDEGTGKYVPKMKDD